MVGSKSLKALISAAMILISPLVAIVLLEAIDLGSLSLVAKWMLTHPQIVLANYLLIGLLMGVLVLITGQLWLTNLLVFGFALFCSSINYFKIIFRGDPLYLEDIYLVRETLGVANNTSLVWPSVITKLVLLILIVVGLGFIFKPRLPQLKTRLKFAGAMILIQGLIITCGWSWFPEITNAIGIDYAFSGNQVESYRTNGLLFGLLVHIYDGHIRPPAGYNQITINNLQASVIASDCPEAPSCPDLAAAPLIIMVMNESWADPTTLPGLTFTKDPLANYHRLQQESVSGELLVKTLGGGTPETEFEVLTGMSNSFHPVESMAYVKYVRRPTPSLIHQAKLAGYATTAIHPYYGWFWQRERVYPELGFQHLIFSDDLEIFDDQLRGNYLADDALGDLIINASTASAHPQLIWAVTMQNHGGYSGQRYRDSDYQATTYAATSSANLSADDHQQLANYLVGLRDGDLLLGKLVEQYRESARPVLIVYFGDHWGTWNDLQVWQQLTGTTNEHESATSVSSFHTIPYLLWNNQVFGTQGATNSGVISGWNLTTKIMEKICLPTTPYYQFITQQAKLLPAYNLGVNYRPDGSVVWDQELNEQEQQAKANHWLWQYDLLLGNNYSGWNQNNDEGV